MPTIMENSVEYYISKGFDIKMAEYFASGRKTIVGVEPNDDFTLTIMFNNGEKRMLDVKPLIEDGTVFEILSQIENFNRVYVDECHCISWDKNPDIDSNIEWDNKEDLCPDYCYVYSEPIE